MANPFKVGDEVIFYQDTMTTETFSSNRQMERFLDEGTILTVTVVGTSFGDNPMVECKISDGIAWSYHPDDLKLADDGKTEDEIYLDNLLRGVK